MGFLTGRRITVTGGAGFLGREVCHALQQHGPAPIFVPRSRDFDLRRRNDIQRMFRVAKPEVIVHLAAVVGGIGANRENPGRFFYENMMMGVQLIEGARLSMLVGVTAPLMAAVIGITLGTASAFFGGWTERVISRGTDMMMSFDPLLLGVLIVALLGPGVQNLSIAIAAALVPPFIRLARALTLSVRQEAYVDASIAMGRSSAGTIGLHTRR